MLGYFQSIPTIAYLYILFAYYVIAVIFAFRGVRRAVRNSASARRLIIIIIILVREQKTHVSVRVPSSFINLVKKG